MEDDSEAAPEADEDASSSGDRDSASLDNDHDDQDDLAESVDKRLG